MAGEKREVSVILPALDEEGTIGECIRKILSVFSANTINGEIIVSDSSSDRTPYIARELGARVIHPKKRGYGNAYHEGFAEAEGEILVIGDADNTYDFTVIPTLIQPIRDKTADIVIGSRLKGKILPGSMPFLHQYLGNPLLTILLNITFGTHFSDCHSGMRAISREAYDKLALHTGGMEYASEMLIEVAKKDLRVAEIPITYYPRIAPSKLHSFADGWRHMRFIMLLRPLPFLMIPGLLFIFLGIAMMLLITFFRPVELQGLHSYILGAIFLTGGVQFVMSGFALKAYAITHGFDDEANRVSFLLNYQSLEKLLGLGILILILGLASGAFIISQWVAHSFGELSEVSNAVISLCSVIIGLQLVFTAILVSMMLLSTDRE
jgi:glycosyltransferase involved in cell wall biosynthesis